MILRKYLCACSAIVLWLTVVASEPSAQQRLFPEPPGLEPNIQFWTRIYSEVDSGSGLLHDLRALDRVYEEIEFPEGASGRVRDRISEQRKKHYAQLLRGLAKQRPSQPTPEEARVLALFAPDVSATTLNTAARSLRFQTGQSDKFLAGLIRSGAYADHVQKTLRQLGLPPELAALPHVESSYTPDAYSRAGAAGLWQFTRSTARRFMRLDHVVDERMDPYISTVAAARLLQQNLRVTGSWPLAITAYNHGPSGMRRAARKLGTHDIYTIVRDYRSRTFGFASRNFYSEFLAALRISRSPESYFGPIAFADPIDLVHVELPFYTTVAALRTHLDVELDTLRTHNPSLLAPVWSGQKRLPRGFEIKLPRSELSRPLHQSIQSMPAEWRFAQQTPDTFHRVQRGETLSHIAARYGARVSELQTLNNLRSRHHIRAGQNLRLPSKDSPAALLTLAADGRYTIQRGDTLEKIARRFHVSEADLVAVNTIRNPHRIQAGQILKVPAQPDVQLAAVRLEVPLEKPEPPPSEPIASVPPSEQRPTEPEVGVMARAETNGKIPDRPLLADPSDYLVSPDGTIEVQVGETLGHYADWLDLRASRLRQLNGMGYGVSLVVHRHIRLDFGSVSRAEFERKRIEFHGDIQEAFFAEWAIDGTETHRLRHGDSLWVLSHRKFNVPLWLLQQYNPDVDFASVPAQTNIIVPKLRRREWDDSA